jgi:AhpD family alkylhydroperoxidase
MDVSGTTDEIVESVRNHLGTAGLYGYVQALYVIDGSTRLAQAMEAIGVDTPMPCGSTKPRAAPLTSGPRAAGERRRRIPALARASSNTAEAAHYQPELTAAIDDFYCATTLLGGVDPILDELVRLRCARQHDCRMCKAGRRASALAAGLTEATLDALDRYELSSLPPRAKVALRLADALVVGGGRLSPLLRRQLLAEFNLRDIVVIALEIVKYSVQKSYVALGLEGVASEADVDVFDFDASGRPILVQA